MVIEDFYWLGAVDRVRSFYIQKENSRFILVTDAIAPTAVK
jgi:hypothetical protein